MIVVGNLKVFGCVGRVHSVVYAGAACFRMVLFHGSMCSILAIEQAFAAPTGKHVFAQILQFNLKATLRPGGLCILGRLFGG